MWQHTPPPPMLPVCIFAETNLAKEMQGTEKKKNHDVSATINKYINIVVLRCILLNN